MNVMNKKTAIFQGTFDPFTLGHLRVLQDALTVFDRVIVLLLINPEKVPLFSVEERKEMISKSVEDLSGVEVDSYQGLLVDYMKERDLYISVRGIRNEKDSIYEMKNHALSKAFYPPLQTLFLACPKENVAISSSTVKQMCNNGEIPANWVPFPVEEALRKKFEC